MTTNITTVDFEELFKTLENKLLNAISSQISQGKRHFEGATNAEKEDAEWADATSATIAEEISRIDVQNSLSQYTPLQKAVDIIHKIMTDDSDYVYLQDFIESLLTKREQRVKGISFIFIVFYWYLLLLFIQMDHTWNKLQMKPKVPLKPSLIRYWINYFIPGKYIYKFQTGFNVSPL